MGLNWRQQRFAEEYCVDGNATNAAKRAGYADIGGHTQGYRLLQNVEVLEAIEAEKVSNAKLAGLTKEWVLKRYMEIAEADPNELVEIKASTCCRHCWGVEFGYQTTEEELMAALDRGEIADASGGFGFDAARESNEDCPVCRGGKPTRVVCKNSKGSKLYAGAKKTKDGIEVKTRDRDEALKILAGWVGVNVNRSELSGPGGGPITTATAANAKELTEEQLAAIIAE